VDLYEAAYSVRMPMMLKGPTGAEKPALLNTWREIERPLIP